LFFPGPAQRSRRNYRLNFIVLIGKMEEFKSAQLLLVKLMHSARKKFPPYATLAARKE
jgi:hypothetical protein